MLEMRNFGGRMYADPSTFWNNTSTTTILNKSYQTLDVPKMGINFEPPTPLENPVPCTCYHPPSLEILVIQI